VICWDTDVRMRFGTLKGTMATEHYHRHGDDEDDDEDDDDAPPKQGTDSLSALPSPPSRRASASRMLAWLRSPTSAKDEGSTQNQAKGAPVAAPGSSEGPSRSELLLTQVRHIDSYRLEWMEGEQFLHGV
jgi:hypothetical protein